MKKINPAKEKDQQILSCIKWGSKLIYKKLRNRLFWEDRLNNIGQAAEEHGELKREDPKSIPGLYRGFNIGNFEKGPFKAFLTQGVALEDEKITPPDLIHSYTREPEEGFLLQIYNKNEPTDQISISFLLSLKRDKRVRLTKGWRKRMPRDSTYREDGIIPYAPLLIYYCPKEGPIYRPIDFFIPAAIFAVQEGFLSASDCFLNDFKKFVFSTLWRLPEHKRRGKKEKEEAVWKKSIQPVASYDEVERNEEQREGDGFKGPFSFYRSKRASEEIDPREIDRNVLRQTLEHIIKGYDRPYNATTFIKYVRNSIKDKKKKYARSRPDFKRIVALAKKEGMTKRELFSRIKRNVPGRHLKAGMIEAYQKKRGISLEGERKWFLREEKKKTWEEIFIKLF